MTVVDDEHGVCPSCRLEGKVGSPCGERGCQNRGYHFVPRIYFDELQESGRSRLEPLIGQVVGDYLPVGVLGQGGFGKVYLALQLPILKLRAALKLMEHANVDPRMADSLLRKFKGEADALASLHHPNIVRLLKYGTHDGIPYLVMEMVADARTLRKHVHSLALKGTQIEANEVRHILRQCVNGLDAAHRLEIVHRDIKPDNVMLQRVAGDDHFVRILDFGLAKFVADKDETSMAMGTPTYMAPEQIVRRKIGPWTDLYALGVMAFELMTGRKPFSGRTQPELVAAKLDPNFDPTACLSDMDVPACVLEFLRRAMALDPDRRYKSASEFRVAVDHVFDLLEGSDTELSETVDLTRLVDPEDPVNVDHAAATECGPSAIATGKASGNDDTLDRVSGSALQSEVTEAAGPRGARKWAAVALGAAMVAVVVLLSTAEPGTKAGSNKPTQSPVAAGEPKEKKPPPPSKGDADRRARATGAGSATRARAEATVEAADAQLSQHVEPEETSRASPSTIPSPPVQDFASVPPSGRDAGSMVPTDPDARPVAVDAAPVASKTLKVTLKTKPARALVLANDEKLGTSPVVIEWTAGDNPPGVEVRKRGYQSRDVKLAATDAGTTKVVRLRRTSGKSERSPKHAAQKKGPDKPKTPKKKRYKWVDVK